MGTLVLLGILHALLAGGLIVAGLSLISDEKEVVFVVVCLAAVQLLLLGFALSSALPYCARAARGEPVRWRHLWHGIKAKWPVTIILLIWLIVAVLLFMNLNLYFVLQAQVSSPGLRLLLVIINAVIGWSLAVACVFLPPWLCAATYSKNKTTAWSAFRDALMSVALLPGIWILLLFMGTALLIVGAFTRIGLTFLIPLMASCSQTAYHLAQRRAGFLQDARAELGAAQSLKTYKARATELGLQWEYRQPRRNFKELIRPWEY